MKHESMTLGSIQQWLDAGYELLGIAYETPTFRLDGAINQVATNEKLRSFTSLPVGWHFGDGVPPSKALISKLVDINNQIYRLGFSKTDAFPGRSGNIMLTIYQGEHLIDLTVEADLETATYLYEKSDEEIACHEDIELSTAIKMIEQVAEICRLSEPYTESTMLKLKVGSKALPLRLLITEGHQSFPQNVQSSILGTYVSTSTNITSQLGSPAVPPFIGNLTNKYYLPVVIENPQ